MFKNYFLILSLFLIIISYFFMPNILSVSVIASETSLLKSPEKALKESTDSLEKIEKKIEQVLDKKNSLEREEKFKQADLTRMEKKLVESNKESRTINYGIKYTEDFIRNLEKEVEAKKTNIENIKLKLNAQLSELVVLSFNKSKNDMLSFLDKSDEYRYHLKIACKKELDFLRSETRLYEQLSLQLQELDKYNNKYRQDSQVVQQNIVKVKDNLNTSKKDLTRISKNKYLAEKELKTLLANQKKLKDMIKSLQKKMAEQKKNTQKPVFKFTGVGTYPWPVNGKILRPFIPDKSSGTYNPGIDISASEGTLVSSIASGIVLFAGVFTGYGNMVIIEHSDNFCTLYSYLQVINITIGQKVERGTIIGSCGVIDTIDEPGIHFELRQDGESIDPGTWLRPSP